MARTMKWPPVPTNGRIEMVEGTEATKTLVLQVLSDLGANPFNDANLSLGETAFRPTAQARARIEAALKRLSRIISVEAVIEKLDEDGGAEYTILFSDRETRVRSEVTVNG